MANKGIKSLWGYPLIDEKGRNAIDDVRSNLENNFQKKTDDTLGTTDKTVPGAINEIKNNIDNIGDNFTSEKTETKYDMKYNGKSIGSINIELEEDQITGGDGSFNIDLTPYQTKNDDTLTTTNKSIVGSINEVAAQYNAIINKRINKIKLSYFNVGQTDNDIFQKALTFCENTKCGLILDMDLTLDNFKFNYTGDLVLINDGFDLQGLDYIKINGNVFLYNLNLKNCTSPSNLGLFNIENLSANVEIINSEFDTISTKVLLSEKLNDIVIVNSKFKNITGGVVIKCKEAKHCYIEKNSFENIGDINSNFTSAIHLGDTKDMTTYCENTRIVNNDFVNMYAKDSTDTLHSYECHAVTICSKNAEINFNTIKNINGEGYDREAIYTKGHNIVISNNDITNGGTGEAYICAKHGENIIISNNIITGEYGSGIRLYNLGKVFGNVITLTSGSNGIYFTSSGNTNLSECYIDRNIIFLTKGDKNYNSGNDGICVISPSCNANILNNDIVYTGNRNGINIENPYYTANVKDNKIKSSSIGINILYSSNVTEVLNSKTLIVSNDITSNDISVQCNSSLATKDNKNNNILILNNEFTVLDKIYSAFKIVNSNVDNHTDKIAIKNNTINLKANISYLFALFANDVTISDNKIYNLESVTDDILFLRSAKFNKLEMVNNIIENKIKDLVDISNTTTSNKIFISNNYFEIGSKLLNGAKATGNALITFNNIKTGIAEDSLYSNITTLNLSTNGNFITE